MVVNGQSAVALQAELAAMHHIALALASLDAATRARVLQWAAQRVDDQAPVTQPAAAPRPLAAVPPRVAPEPEPAVVTDEALSVTALDDLFQPVPTAAAVTEPAPQPVVGLLHDFVVEFQNIARDWNVAVAEPADRAADQRASSAA